MLLQVFLNVIIIFINYRLTSRPFIHLEYECPTQKIKCNDHTCSLGEKCNGWLECKDGSDEDNCEGKNHVIIYVSWVNDVMVGWILKMDKMKTIELVTTT